MKKLMAFLLVASILLALAACGDGDSGDRSKRGNKGTTANVHSTTAHDHSSNTHQTGTINHTTHVGGQLGTEEGSDVDDPTNNSGDETQGDTDTTSTTTRQGEGSTSSVITTTTKRGDTTVKTTTTTTTKKTTTTTTKKTTTTTTKKTTTTKRVNTTLQATTVKSHTFSSASYTRVDDNYHKATGKCSVCGVSTTQKEPHSWGTWKYDTYPTSTTNGVKYRACKGCGYEQVTYVPMSSANTANFEKEMFNLINAERAKYGLPAYTYYTSAQSGADTRAKELLDFFSHSRPDGTKWWTVAGFDSSCQAGAENIARGYGMPQDVMSAFMASPDHRANILSTKYTHVAIGYYDGAWVQIFTKPW